MKTVILGISAFYHDSAAALIADGEIIAAAQEERFTRIKHDPSFPIHAIKYVLSEAGIDFNDLTAVAFYDKPLLKFERLLETYHAFVPRGLVSFITAIPVWIKEKLFMKRLLKRELLQFGEVKQLLFPEHHLSHAASAFYPSPYQEATILTIDGVGEWSTAAIFYGVGNRIKVLKELHFPHSVGLFYSAFTSYLGFKVNSGEYKLMGLAPYGEAGSSQTAEFKQKIVDYLVDIRDDGSIVLNMDYFNYASELRMVNSKKWELLFGVPQRIAESELSQIHMNLALAAQEVTEQIVIRLAQTAANLTKCRNLVMAGGVALNCVSNSKLADSGVFENIWIQPAAGDAGGALGAALAAFYIWHKQPRISSEKDGMKNAYIGPSLSTRQVKNLLDKYNVDYDYFDRFTDLSAEVSKKLAKGSIIAWVQGRMEFGPRALGNRSILADPGNPSMQQRLNLSIKFRESFRPFAPSVLEEDAGCFFSSSGSSPYMLFVKPLKRELRKPVPDAVSGLYERLYQQRSDLPAITHIDYSARVQTVSRNANPKLWQLLTDFKEQTGYGVLVNTSFNIRGEPIVCTAEDAYLGLMRTEIDYLAIGNFLIDRKRQLELPQKLLEKYEFVLD